MRRRTGAELFERSLHAYHAVRTLHALVDLLVRDEAALCGVTGARKEVLWNGLLASFCVHFRAVYDFLYSQEGDEDDVLAAEFFPPPDRWAPAGPTGFVRRERERVQTALEKISALRDLLPTECEWDVARIYNALYPDIEAFRMTAPGLEVPWKDSFAPPELEIRSPEVKDPLVEEDEWDNVVAAGVASEILDSMEER